jgi:hypothetical protein
VAERCALPPADDVLLAPPDAACCVGACGPIFETPLLEQLFNRVRGAVSGRSNPALTPTARPAPGAEGWTTDD